MKLFRSLAFKNAIFYFGIFLIGLIAVSYLLLTSSSAKILETAKNQLKHRSELVENQFKEHLGYLKKSINYLSEDPVLKKYLSNKTPENYKTLIDNYVSIIRSNENLSQIRFLSINQGKEAARVERKEGTIHITPDHELQLKGDRNYFKETIKLAPQKIYFSEINLNREYGAISFPKNPTLRLSSPIYLSGNLVGIVIINANLTELFSGLKKTAGSNFVLRILNEKGFYLMHEDDKETFTFEFGATKQQFDISSLDLSGNTILDKPQKISIYKSIHFDKMNKNIVAEILANRNVLMSDYATWKTQSLFIILIIGIVFILLAFFALDKQAKTLITLTEKLKNFSVTKEVSDLPIKRNDEIGVLSKTFEEMTTVINRQFMSIQAAREKSQIAEKEKTQFLENISHEIRNPLQAILGLIKLLEQNDPKPNQIGMLKSIALNTSNLEGLSTSILDFLSERKGRYKASMKWLNIEELVSNILLSAKYLASNKLIIITGEVDQSLSNYKLRVDELRLSQLLNNLITNALIHSSAQGKIFVKVKNLVINKNDCEVLFLVQDDGKGMDSETLNKINQRYFSSKNTYAKNHNFGLGLTIVNELLQLMDSKLVIESQLQKGTTFSFKLCLPIKERSKNHDHDTFKQLFNTLNILVIEDDVQIIEFYKYHLSEVKVIDFITDLNNLDTLKTGNYDVIITDFRLNTTVVTNKIETIKKLGTSLASLVVASGSPVKSSLIEELFPEVQYLLKPFDKKKLYSTIMQSVIFSKYGVPDFNQIQKDYDFREDKFAVAKKILIEEWKTLIHRFNEIRNDNNLVEFENILHKLNTTLRRLQLSRLEFFFNLKKEIMKKDGKKINESIKEIEMIMLVYLAFLERK